MSKIGTRTHIPQDWCQVLGDTLDDARLEVLFSKLATAYATTTIYPPATEVFTALALCPFQQVRVVVLGQDPYHGPHEAHGLAFSVRDGVKIPPSLRNIFKEIQADVGGGIPSSGDLTYLAQQGVLLLNTALTVEADRPASHRLLGWDVLTTAVVAAISKQSHHVVFMLWGKHAAGYIHHIDTTRHCVLTAPHPSPLSAYTGFFGCRHFSAANEYLSMHGRGVIQWL